MKKITVLTLISCFFAILSNAQPLAPQGFKWELEKELSDEFNQGTLDTEKWNDSHPGWRGRTPSHFKRENVSVADGMLQLKSTSMVDSKDEVKDTINDAWINSAAVSSKKRIAQPGWYYETRMKASNISMTSSFWFRMGDYSEIDVIEHIGNPTNPDRLLVDYNYGCNSHVYGSKKDQGFSIGDRFTMPTRGADEFHVYGLWWKDPNTLLFYHNGVLVMQVTPAVPFEENLHMIWDTEAFKWQGYPTIESLKDDTKNTMYVDYVRTYKLEEFIRPDKGYHNIVN